MAAYIQDIKSQLYFSATDRWVKELERASEFDCGSSAILTAIKARLPHVQIVLYFPGQPLIRFPLKEWKTGTLSDSSKIPSVQPSF